MELLLLQSGMSPWSVGACGVAIDWVRDGLLLLSIVLCQSKRVFCSRVRHDGHLRGALSLHLGDGVSAIWL